MKAPSRSFAYHGGNSQGEGDQEVTDNRQVLFSLLSSYTHVPHFIAFQFITHHRYSVFYKFKVCSYSLERVYQCHFSNRLR